LGTDLLNLLLREARLDERAEVLGVLELMEQLEQGLIKEVAQPEGIDIILYLSVLNKNVLQRDHVGLYDSAKISRVTGACLHAKRESG